MRRGIHLALSFGGPGHLYGVGSLFRHRDRVDRARDADIAKKTPDPLLGHLPR